MRFKSSRATLGLVLAVGVTSLLAASCREHADSKPLAARTLELKGTVAAVKVANLLAPFDSVVRSVPVSEGASVKAGEIVVRLSSAALAHEVETAVSHRELASARLAALRSHEETSAVALRASVARTQARRDRMKALYASRDVTLDDLEAAENEYETAMRDLAASGTSRSASSEEVRAAEIEVKRAAADARFAAERRALLDVRAPFDGVVTRLGTLAGQSLVQREQIGQVVATSDLQVRADAAPEIARLVTAGTPVEVTIHSVPPRVLRETISYVVPAEDAAPGSARTRFVVKLSARDASIAPGTPATLTIRLQ